jgi:hypothetical protein
MSERPELASYHDKNAVVPFADSGRTLTLLEQVTGWSR